MLILKCVVLLCVWLGITFYGCFVLPIELGLKANSQEKEQAESEVQDESRFFSTGFFIESGSDEKITKKEIKYQGAALISKTRLVVSYGVDFIKDGIRDGDFLIITNSNKDMDMVGMGFRIENISKNKFKITPEKNLFVNSEAGLKDDIIDFHISNYLIINDEPIFNCVSDSQRKEK